MDEFSYLSVLLSVILGLAVTQILKGFRGLLLSRARIQIDWPVIAWAALLLRIMREGTGADRQLAAYERTHDMKAVADHIVAETYEGLNVPGQAPVTT